LEGLQCGLFRCGLPTGKLRVKPSSPSAAQARTAAEALAIARERAADPNCKPISRHFGKCKGILGGDGVAHQRAIHDEWD